MNTYVPIEHEYIEFAEVDDIWVRAYSMKKAESIAGQHVHAHDHMTIVSSGKAGSLARRRSGGRLHSACSNQSTSRKAPFKALTDDVVFCCIHTKWHWS